MIEIIKNLFHHHDIWDFDLFYGVYMSWIVCTWGLVVTVFRILVLSWDRCVRAAVPGRLPQANTVALTLQHKHLISPYTSLSVWAPKAINQSKHMVTLQSLYLLRNVTCSLTFRSDLEKVINPHEFQLGIVFLTGNATFKEMEIITLLIMSNYMWCVPIFLVV